MIGRGNTIWAQGGPVRVEDIDEGHRFSFQTHPPSGVRLRVLGESLVQYGPRSLVLLKDGRDLVVAPTLMFRTLQGFLQVRDLLPGTLVEGPIPGVISHVEACDTGAMHHFPKLENLVFVVDGIEARFGGYA